MADDTNSYNLNNVFTFRTVRNSPYTANISIYAGKANITVFNADRNAAGPKGPVYKLCIGSIGNDAPNRLRLNMMADLIDIMKAAPETTKTGHLYTYSLDSKQYVQSGTISYVKDEKQVCSLVIRVKELDNPLEINFSTPLEYSRGTDTPTEAQRSADSIKSLVSFLDKSIPTLLVASCFNKPKPNFNRGGNAPRGNNNGGGYQSHGGSEENYTSGSDVY